MDNDNEVKVILPRNFFLTKTVKEIKCKPIVAWLENLKIYHVQRWLQCLQQACTNLVTRKNIEQVHTVELLFDNIFIAW